ncbi:MAG TPA: PKD domain-containing protein, partial [Gemmatimonadota bacterium]|nr:PKD domain-containing protein [Gemmatimonadota bacterium]
MRAPQPRRPKGVARAATRALEILCLALVGTVACSDRAPTELPEAAAPDRAPTQQIRQSEGPAFVPGRILVGFEEGVDDDAQAALLSGQGALPGRRLGVSNTAAPHLVAVPPGREVATAAALARAEGVAFAEPDWIRTITPVVQACDPCLMPSDPQFDLKWDLHNTGSVPIGLFGPTPTGGEDADMDWLEAFDHLGPEFVGEAVIGIIDTGIRSSHEDICGKVIGGRNFLTGQSGGEDDHGHGTHVGGIAAACGNNDVGVAGVAYGPNVRLLAAKVCDANGNCPSSAVAEAMEWVADNGADVMNLSLGDPVYSASEHASLQYATAQGVLAVCAAGNDGTNNSILFPAANPECVAVTATNWGDGRASYSNAGPEAELAAPGGDVEDFFFGTSFILSLGIASDADYVGNLGTSMASPQVAGLAGLLFALGIPTADEVRQRMRNSADDLGASGWDPVYGHGRINVYNAVADLEPPPPPPNDPPLPSLTFDPPSPQANETVVFDGSASVDPDGSITAWTWDFGDGSPTASGAVVEHAYTATGSYTVTLTVTDNRSLSSSSSEQVTVAAGPGTLVAPALRLDARTLGLSDGGPVPAWSDPASGRTATAPTTAAEGVYRTGATPSGTPVVHFLGNDHYEVPDDGAMELDGSSTVIAVYASDVNAQQTLVAKHSDGATAGAYLGGFTSGGQPLIDRPWIVAGPRGSTSIGTGTFHVVAYRISGSNVAFRVDGAPAGGGSLVAGTPSDRPLRIGMVRHRSPAVDEFFLRGKLADLLVFDRAIGDQDLAAWEAELQATHLVDNNVGPAAVAAINPGDPQVNETVIFDGSGSSDPDGSVASYSWDLGDGSAPRSGVTTEHTYASAGSYQVVLTVTDNKGATDTDTRTLVVGPTAGTLVAPTLRLDASSLGLADGAAVASWPDPATGRTATAPHAGAQALFETNQTPGGTPAVHFQGDDHYEVADEAALEMDDGSSTVIAVYAADVATQQVFLAKHTDGASAGAFMGAVTSDGRPFIDRPWKETGPRATASIGTGSFRIVSYRISSGRVGFRIDGVAAGSGTIGDGVATNQPLRVGMIRHRSPAVDEYFLRGRLADLVVFDRSLGDQDLTAWEDALRATHIEGTPPPPNEDPTASFTYGPASPETGEVVSFDGSGSSDSDGTIASYAWDWGDGSAAGSGVSPMHSYGSAGDYTVTLTVTDDQGGTDQTSQVVSVSDPPPPPNESPTAAFSVSCIDNDCTFTDLSTDADGTVVSWSWDFGDGRSSTAQSP